MTSIELEKETGRMRECACMNEGVSKEKVIGEYERETEDASETESLGATEGGGTCSQKRLTAEENNNDIPQRGYLKNVPEPLGKGEWECEIAERKARKKNIFVRGIRTTGIGIGEELKGIIEEKMGMTIYIKRIRAIGGGLVIELESMQNKIALMKNKKNLGKTGIWIEDDYTNREREIQSWLENIEKEERRNGLEAMTGYQKIRIQGSWYEWSEEKGRLEEQGGESARETFRK